MPPVAPITNARITVSFGLPRRSASYARGKKDHNAHCHHVPSTLQSLEKLAATGHKALFNESFRGIVARMMTRAHITSLASKGLLSRDILLLSCLGACLSARPLRGETRQDKLRTKGITQ
jgi:hypothetical protein